MFPQQAIARQAQQAAVDRAEDEALEETEDKVHRQAGGEGFHVDLYADADGSIVRYRNPTPSGSEEIDVKTFSFAEGETNAKVDRHNLTTTERTTTVRSAGRLKLGYYPLPSEEGRRLRRLLHADEPFSVIDPCAGTGAALHLLTEGMDCKRYGVELDADRASAAVASGIQMVQGNAFDAHARVESFSLLYLNPPYDSEVGSLDNKRMEFLFLEHTYRWLVVGGVLVFVVPQRRLTECQTLLAAHFTDFRLFRLSDPESTRFNQFVLTAVRKPMRGNYLEINRVGLLRIIYHTPPLDLEEEHEPYLLPPTPPAGLAYRGLPLDEIEDLLPQSAVWKQVAPFLLPKEEMTSGRPITPLHAGHVGLLCTAGLLNGIFGSGSDRHIARWRSIKHVTIVKEQEDDTSIIRKKERFSNELSLVYEDGRTLLLTESPRQEPQEDESEECASTDRAA